MNISNLPRFVFSACALIALPLILSACADDQDMTDTQAQAVIPMPPQAPLEIPPQLANPQGEIWRPGYWVLSDNAFVWIPGKIIPRPSPTAVWNPARWDQHNYGWSFREGHWE